jgi:hypothetical protein
LKIINLEIFIMIIILIKNIINLHLYITINVQLNFHS